MERPKRPLSGYMIWLNENREQIKAENPGFKITEIAKRGGELWRGLTDKSEWDRKAIEAKGRYTQQMAAFEASGGCMDSGSGTKRGRTGGKGGAKKGKY